MKFGGLFHKWLTIRIKYVDEVETTYKFGCFFNYALNYVDNPW